GLVCVPSVGLAQIPTDYDVKSTEWNGMSQFGALAVEHGVTLVPGNLLDYSALDPSRPLILVYPTQPLDVASLQEFVADGGRILLADDFGSSAALLSSFSEPIRRRDPSGTSQAYLNGNPNLPVLQTPGRHALLEGGVDALVGNHPTGFSSVLPAVVYFDVPIEAERLGFAYDLTIGEGKIIVLGDASMLINLMIDMADNRRFLGNALDYLCERRPAGQCAVDVYVGPFESTGTYGDAAGESDPAA